MKKRVMSIVLVIIMVFGLVPVFPIPASAATRVPSGSIISAGRGSSFAILDDGSLWAWGSNESGQLGDGTFGDRNIPVKILDNVVSVSAGNTHAAAIRQDGSLWAWGSNYHEQIGTGPNIPSSPLWGNNIPIRIMSDVTYVSAGNVFTVAIRTDGSLWGWGTNYDGQLGIGTYESSATPIKIMDDVVAVSAGDNFTAAIKSDGSLWTWGGNTFGQLGSGDDAMTNPTPTKIMENVVYVSAGPMNTMVIRSDGSLWGWGQNIIGQLGLANLNFSRNPVRITEDVVAVSAGATLTAAIRGDDSLWTWGANFAGQLGDGTTQDRHSPVSVFEDAIAVSVGNTHVLAVKTDGSLWAWGGNFTGSVGDGTPPFTSNRHSPVRVLQNVAFGGLNIDQNATIIRTAAELAAIGGPDSAGQTFVLANDLTLPGNWMPITDFRGTFDGAGHVITLSANRGGHLATAGLFGVISEGEVAIRNVGVRTPRGGRIRATANNSTNSRAFAGGLVGSIISGNVRIENSFFDGSISAHSTYDKVVSGMRGNPVQNAPGLAANFLQGVTPWVSATVSLGKAIIEGFGNTGSFANAGGLVGSVEGNAVMHILNSYASGSVHSRAHISLVEFSGWIGTVRAHSFSGGLVGRRTGSARLIIENSYVTNNVEASAAESTFGRPDSNAGAMVGGGGAITSGRNYRLNTQSVTADWRRPLIGTAGNRGHTNTSNVSAGLTNTQMQNRASFVGWDFNNVWTTVGNKNNGFPYAQIFDQSFEIEPPRAFSVFTDGFSAAIGSGEQLTMQIDMPNSALQGVAVNGTSLTQGTHFAVRSGSTYIDLLPGFIDTLDGGFHTIVVSFDGGITAQEEFLVLTEDEVDGPPPSRLYMDGQLIFTAEDGLLVGEDQLDGLYAQMQHFRIELADGQVFEGNYEHDEPGGVLRLAIGSVYYSLGTVTHTIEAAPFIDDGRTMVPVRLIAEAMGADVGWIGETRTVTIEQGAVNLQMTIGAPLPYGMGTPTIVADRTFVPVRYISEMLGADVRWDGDARAVYVYLP